jgi:hypothetical protein
VEVDVEVEVKVEVGGPSFGRKPAQEQNTNEKGDSEV